MKSTDRLEELAAGYVLGTIGPEELRELEELLGADDSAREFFAEFCMDEILLQNAMTRSAGNRPELVPTAPPEPERDRARHAAPLVRAAALLLTFVMGWGASSVVSPADLLERDAGELPPVANGPRPSLPIYYPPTATPVAARPVVYPLDFDESGTLSTNPFLQFQPMESTDL